MPHAPCPMPLANAHVPGTAAFIHVVWTALAEQNHTLRQELPPTRCFDTARYKGTQRKSFPTPIARTTHLCDNSINTTSV
jgi:hypothetical protein